MAKEMHTPDSMTYVFFPLTEGCLNFQVQADKEAHIALSSCPNLSGPRYEIILGGWNNTKSAIRRDGQLTNVAEAYTPSILSLHQKMKFCIKWKSGNIEVSRAGSIPFLVYHDQYPFPIGFYGLRTGWDTSGNFHTIDQYPSPIGFEGLPTDWVTSDNFHTIGNNFPFQRVRRAGQWLIEGYREISTQDRHEYQFWPIPSGAVTVDVRCSSDAHIALISSPSPIGYESFPHTEIFIGGWKNAQSAIRRNGKKPDRAIVETRGIVSNSEFRRFRIIWKNGKLSLKHGHEASIPILEYYDGDPIGVTHFGVRTAWGHSGYWKVREGDETEAIANTPTFWKQVNAGNIPCEAFVGGKDHSCNLYVGRAHHEGDTLPGKINPVYRLCYVSWDGKEYGKDNYEVLCGRNLKWVPCSNANIPETAVHGGCTKNGEQLYIGRASHERTLAIGKVHPSHRACYIPYGGKEFAYKNYEILIYN